jgi:hypothetical protein
VDDPVDPPAPAEQGRDRIRVALAQICFNGVFLSPAKLSESTTCRDKGAGSVQARGALLGSGDTARSLVPAQRNLSTPLRGKGARQLNERILGQGFKKMSYKNAPAAELSMSGILGRYGAARLSGDEI